MHMNGINKISMHTNHNLGRGNPEKSSTATWNTKLVFFVLPSFPSRFTTFWLFVSRLRVVVYNLKADYSWVVAHKAVGQYQWLFALRGLSPSDTPFLLLFQILGQIQLTNPTFCLVRRHPTPSTPWMASGLPDEFHTININPVMQGHITVTIYGQNTPCLW